MSDDNILLTMPVVDAGRRYFGLARNASYRAARSGDIPCVKIGGRWLASIPAIERLLRECGHQKGSAA